MNFKTSFLLALTSVSLLSGAGPTHWVVTWGASAAPPREETEMRAAKLAFENQTIREIVHSSIGGDSVRVRLSNAYGKRTAEIGAAHIALSGKKSDIVPGSDHALTFSGRPTISIPPDAVVVSDPVKMEVSAAQDVTISLFFPKQTVGAGVHYSAQQTAYIGSGDLTGAASMTQPETVESWVFLGAVDVMAGERASTLVAFGDSITDGAHSTTDANHRWPNFLADRLLAKHKRGEIGILD